MNNSRLHPQRTPVGLATILRTLLALHAAPLGWTACVGGCASHDAAQPAAADDPSAVGVTPTASPFNVELPNTTASLKMVPIPAGEVIAADPSAPGGHRTIPVGPFWMSQTEVTWDLFDIYVYRLDETEPTPEGADAISRPSKPYLPPDRGFGHAGYPAISIAHDSAAQFCAWLSAKTGRRFRLATEAEWEFACQGSPIAEMPLDSRAWHAGNSDGKTHPVGGKLPNSFGLHDMLGNVAEWTEGLDGKPVTRGGSFAEAPETLNCQTRAAYNRSWQSRDPQIPKSKWWLSDGPFVGFRVLCEVEADASR